jgi:hypothetical protein
VARRSETDPLFQERFGQGEGRAKLSFGGEMKPPQSQKADEGSNIRQTLSLVFRLLVPGQNMHQR